MEIVIASQNVHKIREFREMFKVLKDFDVLSLLHFSHYEPAEEVGQSFSEIATMKAAHAAKHLQKYVLADDSGVVVPALNGAPGVYSRRYAGLDATDAENREKLIQAMQGFTELERAAYFECSLALADPEGNVVKVVNAICEGHILFNERGRHGFGYDSLFLKHDYDKTFAELDEQTKNRISHRHKAFEKLLPTLESLGR